MQPEAILTISPVRLYAQPLTIRIRSLVQRHGILCSESPLRKDKVIVYAAPEGDEVATHTRGTARLANGEARVSLGETFPG